MAFQGDSIFWVEVEKVVPNPFQPRREFDEEKLKELAESIKMYGVLQPLTVTRKEVHNDDGSFMTQYELIAGERRLRASRLAAVAQVPVIIRSGEQTEQEKLELAIIENLQREDLNAVDRALAFKQLAESFELSHAQVAKKVGRSREYVSNSIRLLALPQHMLDGLKRGDITEGHARTLLMLKDKPEEQEVVYREILLKKLSVREVERISRKIANDKVRKREYKDMDAHLIEFEKEFTDTLGTRVQILKTDFGGKLTIDYFSDEDLDNLLKIMREQNAKINAAAAFAASQITDQASSAATVGETVIREMDELSESIRALENATAIESTKNQDTAESESTVSVDPAIEDTTLREAQTPRGEEEIAEETSQAVPEAPLGVTAPPMLYEGTADTDAGEQAVDEGQTEPSEAPREEEQVPPPPTVAATTDEPVESPQYEPARYEEDETEHNVELAPTEAAAVPVPDQSEADDIPSQQEEATEPATQGGETDTASLRARLEAELVRLEAEDEARKEEPVVSPQSEAAQPSSQKPVPQPPKKEDSDDDLYSIRNFSL